MQSNFPKTLTIELPALQREALREISRREPCVTPAQLLERLLAAGIASKLASYPGTFEDSSVSVEERAFISFPASTSLNPMHLRLNRAQSERVHRIGVGSRRTTEELALWLLEWGLDAYEESLHIVQPVNLENGVRVR